VKPFLVRGVLAGVCGALASVGMLLALGERSIREAISLEEATSGGGGDDAMFTRTTQVVGGSIGVLLYGVFLGLIFGVVFAAVRHRLGPVPDWKRSLRLAGLGFLSLALVPFLKYPPNPPAVGDPDTVNQRTISYLCLLGLALVVTIAARRLWGVFQARGWSEHVALPAVVAAWVLAIGVAFVVMPANPDDIDVSAQLVWRFRLASLGGQAALWAVIGVVFGWLGIRHSGVRVFARAPRDTASSGD